MIKTLILTLKGQPASGKNHVQITRTGRRYPLPAWVEWRTSMLSQINSQKMGGFEPFKGSVSCHIKFYHGDKRRRDADGLIGALFHCFEKSGLVNDDRQFTHGAWETNFDKENPRVEVVLAEI